MINVRHLSGKDRSEIAPPKTISVESYTCKMLCRQHNSALSPLDDAAAEAFRVFRQSDEVYDRHSLLPPYKLPNVETLRIRARPLERWLLKTMLNFEYQKDFLIGPTGKSPGRAPADLVRICFGQGDFEGKAGMYVAAGEGMQFRLNESVEYRTVHDGKKRLVAAIFKLRGLLFVLDLDPHQTRGLDKMLGEDGGAWSGVTLMRPINSFTRTAWGRTSNVVQFDWSK